MRRSGISSLSTIRILRLLLTLIINRTLPSILHVRHSKVRLHLRIPHHPHPHHPALKASDHSTIPLGLTTAHAHVSHAIRERGVGLLHTFDDAEEESSLVSDVPKIGFTELLDNFECGLQQTVTTNVMSRGSYRFGERQKFHEAFCVQVRSVYQVGLEHGFNLSLDRVRQTEKGLRCQTRVRCLNLTTPSQRPNQQASRTDLLPEALDDAHEETRSTVNTRQVCFTEFLHNLKGELFGQCPQLSRKK